MITCIALNSDSIVKASVVARSTPARVMVRKVAKPAMIVIEGLIVLVSDWRRADFLRFFTSSFLRFSILCVNGCSQAYILISLMELMISLIMVTLLSVIVTTFKRSEAERDAMTPCEKECKLYSSVKCECQLTMIG